jgi:hypothetical protein
MCPARPPHRRPAGGGARAPGRRRFVLCLLGLAACEAGPGPGEPPPDARTATDAAGGTAPEPVPDATRGAVAGAACAQTTDCLEGRCLHGVCSPTCTDDAGCPSGLHCVDRGGGGHCTRTCGPALECPAALVCVPDAPGRGGCRAPGAGPAGAECAGPEACASWSCVQGRCLAACNPGPPCGPGEICLALHVGGVCVAAGDGGLEAPCRVGADCASGLCRGGGCSTPCDATVTPDPCPNDRRCVAYATLALCERPCGGADDCGPRGLCLVEGDDVLCQTRGDAPAGAPCDRASDCREGHCTDGACGAACAAGCPAATACVRDITGATCRPAGGQPENAPCTTGAECRSGFCAAGRCGRDCAAGPDCPAGMACVGFAEGRFCFPRCMADTDCEAPAFCADGLAAEPVCFWRGAVADGATCREDFECRSGLCRGGGCRPPCRDGNCPGGTECRDFGRGPFCTDVPAPLGAECSADDACSDGLRCTAGRCLPVCGETCPPEAVCPPEGEACHPVCARDADCRPGFVCQKHTGPAAFCAPRGTVPDSAPCARGSECRSGLCHGGRCRPDCIGCTPGGGLSVGTPCERDAACASGLCVAGVCAHPCPEAGCGAGRACLFVDDARVCLSLCEKGDLDCDPGLSCAPEAGGTLVCRGDRAGRAGEGSACAEDDTCAVENPVCRSGRCHRLCDRDADCGEDRRCAETRAGLRLCVDTGASPPMAPCVADAACESGLCEGGRCFRACADGCGPAGRCEDAARDPAAPDRRCVPACEPAAARCPEGTLCRAGADGLAGCY